MASTAKKNWLYPLYLLALVLFAAYFVNRSVTLHKLPLQSLSETLGFFVCCIGVVFVALRALYKVDYLTAPVFALSAALAGYAFLQQDIEVFNLPPALQSVWFIPHVTAYFLAYALFAISGLASAVYLKLSPKSPRRNDVSHFCIAANYIGFACATLGLVIGAIWAKQAWGDYWNWDPKENWALITWLSYLLVIHSFFIPKWKERRSKILNLVALCFVFFTYLGFYYLPTGMISVHIHK